MSLINECTAWLHDAIGSKLRTSPSNDASTPLYVTGDLAIGDVSCEYGNADGDVSAVKAIYATTNGVSLAESNDTYQKATVIGISRTGASDGNTVQYKTSGKFQDSTLNFPLDCPLFLGSNGSITDQEPTGLHRTRIGFSLGNGAIMINIDEPIIL